MCDLISFLLKNHFVDTHGGSKLSFEYARIEKKKLHNREMSCDNIRNSKASYT